MALVRVAGGCYPMGASGDDCDATPEERPAHEVCVGEFLIGRFEVTRRQWRAVMGDSALRESTCAGEDCPVDGVGWSDVQEFLARLNAAVGEGRYRLPTEAEWEYAARSGGRAELFSGGTVLADAAWFRENSGRVNHPVGTRAGNALGLHDMSGNVWELTSDWYDAAYYAVSPRDNPAGPASGTEHVLRGGSRSDAMPDQRATRRATLGAVTRGVGSAGNVGFRVVLSR